MESLEGVRLGRFRIKRLIGKGGMGEVYSAVDEHLDRDVAIKVLGAAVDVEPHRRRFLREARLAARLTHPNIASIFEVGDSDGRLYIVMELLEGESLRSLLAVRRLTIAESLSVARDMARALARAHAGDVMHRDIKPENVFITQPAPGALVAKVLDFGLARDEQARERADRESTTTDVTGPGEACGTAGYLAPEQARGLVVGIRADIFSFGVVLYEMLAGRRAFNGVNQLARMLAVVKDEVEPLRASLPDIDPALEAVVERCLAKAPSDRYADGSALLAALEEIVRRLGLPGSTGSFESSHDGTFTGGKGISTVTPAPQIGETGDPASSAPRIWPLLIAAAVAVVIGVTLISVSLAKRLDARAVDPPAPRSAEVAGARVADDAPSASTKVVAPPSTADEPASSDEPAAEPAASSSASASASIPARTGTPSPRPTSTLGRIASASASAPAAPVPPPPEPPKVGTVRIQQDVMTIVVDGEHRRVRDGAIVLPCGRHRIRAGLKGERVVDVPCGGATTL